MLIDAIDQIVAVPGVDACLIAPFDLAMSYGYRDGPEHPEVQAAIKRAEQAIVNSPVASRWPRPHRRDRQRHDRPGLSDDPDRL